MSKSGGKKNQSGVGMKGWGGLKSDVYAPRTHVHVRPVNHTQGVLPSTKWAHHLVSNRKPSMWGNLRTSPKHTYTKNMPTMRHRHTDTVQLCPSPLNQASTHTHTHTKYTHTGIKGQTCQIWKGQPHGWLRSRPEKAAEWLHWCCSSNQTRQAGCVGGSERDKKWPVGDFPPGRFLQRDGSNSIYPMSSEDESHEGTIYNYYCTFHAPLATKEEKTKVTF